MADDDSDYVLMSSKEVSRLKREPKHTSSNGSDTLENSINKLNSSINKLISILEDAQEDIIEEYQESKPVEKLNQLMDQNETIANAIISMHNTLKKSMDVSEAADDKKQSQFTQSRSQDVPIQQPMQMPPYPGNNQPFQQMQQFQRQSPSMNPQTMSSMPSMSPSMDMPIQQQPNPIWDQQHMQIPSPGNVMNLPNNPRSPPGSPMTPPLNNLANPPFSNPTPMNDLGDLPPLDLSNTDLPPLDNTPPAKKKKFLGLI